MRPGTIAAGLAALLVAGCATPAELKRPPSAPTMAGSGAANPLPGYAAPDSDPHP